METNNDKIEQMNKEAKAFVQNFIEKFNISTDGDFNKINLELHQVLKNPNATKKEVFYTANLISKNWYIKTISIYFWAIRIGAGIIGAFFTFLFFQHLPLDEGIISFIGLIIATVTVIIFTMLAYTKIVNYIYEYIHKKFLDKLVESNPSLGGYKAHLQEQKRKKMEFLIRAYKEMEENGRK